MKHVFRFIGVVVVLVVLAALVLYFLNGQGYIRGPLSKWITSMQSYFNGAVEDTQKMFNEYHGNTPDPRPDSLQTPELNGLEDLATAEPVQVPEITPEPTPEA